MIHKYVDTFLIKDYVNNLINRKNDHKIGWVVPKASPYKCVMASTRIRVYDIVNYINTHSTGICSCLYRKYSSYDIVVFQKVFRKRYHDLAAFLKGKNVKVVYDININDVPIKIANSSAIVDHHANEDIRRMVSLADSVIASSKHLCDVYKEYNDNVVLIEESIPKYFFEFFKEHTERNIIKLIYCGYAIKAWEIKPIADVLNKINAKQIELILICDHDPKLDFINYKYIHYNFSKLPEILLRGDICIAPRDVTVGYNLGHAFTKIGYPMSVGLNVLASPVPSYEGSPAILCDSVGEWESNLNELITNVDKRKFLARIGREYCLENYSLDVIGEKYLEYFNKIIN